MEVFKLGSSKKAVEEKLLKFLKRLATIEDRWLVANDIWVPAARSKKTRPGLHCTRNSRIQLNSDCAELVYVTEPIGEIIEHFNNIPGKVQDVDLIHNPEMITLEVRSKLDGSEELTLIVIATRVVNDEMLKNYPLMFKGSTFQSFVEGQGYWVEISKETLMSLKQGNLFQVADDGFVLIRMTRNMLKLRGRSERKDADITYTARYCLINSKNPMEMIGAMGLLILVDYGFMEAISYYITIPFPISTEINEGTVDLGLFDEDDADDGLEVVD